MGMRQMIDVLVPALLGLAVAGASGGNELPKPGDKPKVVREQVQGQWRSPGEKLLRITGRVKVLDAHTLRFEDGTVVNINGGMDAPELGQQGLIGGSLYPCGKEAAAFLEKLIGDRPVTCYSDSDDPIDAKNLARAEAFVRETNLEIEMVRNGWAMAHHSGMAAWEVIARDNKRGLWRGTFVFPEKWRKGERLPQEK
jgi:endonuclease YncB( thermonuclease family)